MPQQEKRLLSEIKTELPPPYLAEAGEEGRLEPPVYRHSVEISSPPIALAT
jgi:hypothetical protein